MAMDPSGQNAGDGHGWQDRWEDEWAEAPPDAYMPMRAPLPTVTGAIAHAGLVQDLPPGRARTPHGDERSDILNQIVERAVIPRLLLGSAASSPADAPDAGGWHPSAEDVKALAAMTLVRDPAYVIDYIAALRAAGAQLETIYLELLSPAARELGERWCDDTCDFTQVTMGVWCLHQVLHAYSHAFQSEGRPTDATRHILLAPAPGEQHTFGLTMVAEFFRRDGWLVTSGLQASADELAAMVRRQSFAIVGLSVAGGVKLEPIGQCIRQLRAATRNPQLGVLVGGPIFVEQPELARLVGADATANDGRHAAQQAARLLGMLASPD